MRFDPDEQANIDPLVRAPARASWRDPIFVPQRLHGKSAFAHAFSRRPATEVAARHYAEHALRAGAREMAKRLGLTASDE